MLITREEYEKRKRYERNFDCDFETFANRVYFPENTIFKTLTWWGEEKYIKITCEFAQIHFDIRECDKNGEFVRFGYRKGSIHKNEIAERIYEGDWKLEKEFV
jgi:hypothetical protein